VDKVAAVRQNPNKKLQNDGIIAIGKTTRSEILDMKFDPSDRIIILACVKEVVFISMEGGVLKSTRGIWDNNPQQAVMCIGFHESNMVTGKDFDIESIPLSERNIDCSFKNNNFPS
jgi:hypothetical protein